MLNNATREAVSPFQALVGRARAKGRLQAPQPKGEPERMKLTGMRLLPAEFEQAKTLAAADERAMARFCRLMYLRGLQSYMAEHGQQQ